MFLQKMLSLAKNKIHKEASLQLLGWICVGFQKPTSSVTHSRPDKLGSLHVTRSCYLKEVKPRKTADLHFLSCPRFISAMFIQQVSCIYVTYVFMRGTVQTVETNFLGKGTIVCPSVSLSISFCLYICLCLSVYICLYLSVCLSILSIKTTKYKNKTIFQKNIHCDIKKLER